MATKQTKCLVSFCCDGVDVNIPILKALNNRTEIFMQLSANKRSL